MTEILLIGGRSGVGKTSVAHAVHELLVRSSVRHAVIEGDYLDLACPAAEQGFAERNLRQLWSAYAEAGYERLIYSQTASVLQLDDICAAVDPKARVTAILLTGSDEEIRHRLGSREATPASLATHLERSRLMAGRLESGAHPHSVRIDTDGRTVSEISEAIVAMADWV